MPWTAFLFALLICDNEECATIKPAYDECEIFQMLSIVKRLYPLGNLLLNCKALCVYIVPQRHLEYQITSFMPLYVVCFPTQRNPCHTVSIDLDSSDSLYLYKGLPLELLTVAFNPLFRCQFILSNENLVLPHYCICIFRLVLSPICSCSNTCCWASWFIL